MWAALAARTIATDAAQQPIYYYRRQLINNEMSDHFQRPSVLNAL